MDNAFLVIAVPIYFLLPCLPFIFSFCNRSPYFVWICLSVNYLSSTAFCLLLISLDVELITKMGLHTNPQETTDWSKGIILLWQQVNPQQEKYKIWDNIPISPPSTFATFLNFRYFGKILTPPRLWPNWDIFEFQTFLKNADPPSEQIGTFLNFRHFL